MSIGDLMRPFFSALAATVFLLAGPTHADPSLVMVEQAGCIYCARWNAEIGPIYPKTPEGKMAPLIRADRKDGPPEGIEYARKAYITPTFILVDDGKELARLEGYPGEDFFWGMLGMMLKAHTDFEKGAS